MKDKKYLIFSQNDIEKSYTSIGKDYMRDLLTQLNKIGFPVGRTFVFKGATVSKVETKKFWIHEDEDGIKHLYSNLVDNNPLNLYVSDLRNPEFIKALYESAENAVDVYMQYKEVEDWVDKGYPCTYTSGWAYRGAGHRRITKEEAKRLLPQYSFGKGFYELSWIVIDGVRTLDFNELSANDMW